LFGDHTLSFNIINQTADRNSHSNDNNNNDDDDDDDSDDDNTFLRKIHPAINFYGLT